MSTMTRPENKCPNCEGTNIGTVGFSRHCRDCHHWFASFVTGKEVEEAVRKAGIVRDKETKPGKVISLKTKGA